MGEIYPESEESDSDFTTVTRL